MGAHIFDSKAFKVIERAQIARFHLDLQALERFFLYILPVTGNRLNDLFEPLLFRCLRIKQNITMIS